MSGQSVNGLDESLWDKVRETYFVLAGELRPKLDALVNADGVPATLCHYTDFAGLNGILDRSALWATYGQVLNDPTEQRYGQVVVDAYAAQRLPPALHRWMAEARQASRSFVTCFCERSDVLSMWKSYASSGGGYCLEFDGHALFDCSFPPHTDQLQLKIAYGPEVPKSLSGLAGPYMQFR